MTTVSMDKKRQINHEILQASKYRSLMLAKHTASILTASYVVLAMIFVRSSTPALYILLANNIFPVIISYVLLQQQEASKKKKEQDIYQLPRLMKKYRYDSCLYRCNSMSFLLTCLFLLLWQQREFKNPLQITALSYSPMIILGIIIAIRTLGIIVLSIRIHRLYMTAKI